MAASVDPSPSMGATGEGVGHINTTTTSNAGQTTPITHLRRAIYVKISDLTNAYDIDQEKLEAELTKAKQQQHQQKQQQQMEEATSSANANASDNNNTNTAGVSDIDTSSYPQNRLQPPRGGYNLCA